MTPEEFYNEIKKVKIEYKDDDEAFHIYADGTMEKCLATLGYGKGIKYLKKQTRWYA
jgi:hypothetical protein